MGNLVFQATLGGQVNLVGPNTASTYNINVPTVNGNMVTTGDTGTVTNTMCATSVYTTPGTIGSGTPNTGAFTTLSASSTTTLSGGTANGVAYLNGSKILTTDPTKLYFDGANFAVGSNTPTGYGITPRAWVQQAADTAWKGLAVGAAGSDAFIGIYYDGSVFNYSASYGSTAGYKPMAWQTGGSERMRLDSAGNLGLGVTPSAWYSTGGYYAGAIQIGARCSIASTSALGTGFFTNSYSSNSGFTQSTLANGYSPFYLQTSTTGQHQWYVTANNSSGANQAVSGVSQAMTLDASGNLGVGTTSPGSKLTVSNGTVTAGMQPYTPDGVCYFGTSSNHGLAFLTNSNERARIDTSGNLLVGSPSTTAKFVVKASANSYAQGACVERTGASNYWSLLCTTANDLYFGYNNADKGYISNSTGVYVAVSDERLKKNITDIQYGLASVLALRSVEYHMNEQDDSEKKNLGFIAQEALEVVPESVSEMMGGMYGMDKSAIIPVLVKAIQELKAEFDAYKAAHS